MKRIFALTLAAILLLCGCGNGGNDKKNEDGADKDNTDKAAIVLKDTTLKIGGELTEEMLNKLGEPNEKTASPNCVYDGAVYEYIYDGFTLQVNEQGDGKNTLLIATISDTAYQTADGIAIGDTLETVKEAYGEPTEGNDYYVVYELSDTVCLTFELEDGKVALILYETVG